MVLQILFVLFRLRLRRFRQQQARLNLQQRRRHDEKFAGVIDVEAVELRDIGVELIGNLRDGNIVNIDFVFFD